MTDNTARQIANMKKQTIGVEVDLADDGFYTFSGFVMAGGLYIAAHLQNMIRLDFLQRAEPNTGRIYFLRRKRIVWR